MLRPDTLANVAALSYTVGRGGLIQLDSAETAGWQLSAWMTVHWKLSVAWVDCCSAHHPYC